MTTRKDSTAAQRGKIRRELRTILDWISAPETSWEDEEAALQAIREPIEFSHPSLQDRKAADPLPEVPNSAEQRVYAAMRDAILDHRLAPGTKLKEVALADLFHVSRATIRGVLARLAHGRLVDLRLNRGAVVASPSTEESREIFEARRTIEGTIAANAARIATAGEIAALRELVAEEKAAYERGDERAGLRISVEFHRMLAAVARNAVLARYLEELILRTPLVALTHRSHATTACGYDEHLALIEAVTAHDVPRAVTLMRGHIDHLESELTRARPAPAKTLAEVFGAPAAEKTEGAS